MALPEKDEIVPSHLHLFVIGPGTGETVLVLIPPESWIIIDSFKCGRPSRPAAQSIVSRYGGRLVILALTHPHQDHHPGFVELIDRFEHAVLGCVHPRDSGITGALPIDAVAALKEGAKPTYTRIWDEWSKDWTRRWETFRPERRAVGEATVTSLHPERPVTPCAMAQRSQRNLIGNAGEMGQHAAAAWRGCAQHGVARYRRRLSGTERTRGNESPSSWVPRSDS